MKIDEVNLKIYDLRDDATATEQNQWTGDIEDYSERMHQLKSNCIDVYYLGREQCTPCIRSELESVKVFRSIESACDILKLMSFSRDSQM